ncbi:MAG: UDP-N-acetylmuramate--L-alanine ligase [Saprospiraceae bacterium]
MRIHFISIGGKAMHNLALELAHNGHHITGSDDEIYNPSRDRLAAAGLLPEKMGWNAERITNDLEAIILGMHARPDNPELARAQELGLPIYSFPAFLYEMSKDKKRVVVAGSHGKTTTTAMIMHVLKHNNLDFDYMVGAQVTGYDRMVRLSDAPIIVLEGDEYLSSPIDRRPKFIHFNPHIAIITGIAWDHINVFPTFNDYVFQFKQLLKVAEKGASIIWYDPDEELQKLTAKGRADLSYIPYRPLKSVIKNGQTFIKSPAGEEVPIQVFGQHNLANFAAAHHACRRLGLTDKQFFAALPTFRAAGKRLEVITQNDNCIAWLDYAHAPSKVQATIEATKAQYPDRELVACLELHTFSSLNKEFHSHYAGTMNAADKAVVFFSEHTLKMKRLPKFSPRDLQEAFGHTDMEVFTERAVLEARLAQMKWENKNLLLMSSGTFDGMKSEHVSGLLGIDG